MTKNSSDQIRLSGTTWGELKDTALRPNYMEKSPFVSTKPLISLNQILTSSCSGPISHMHRKRDAKRAYFGTEVL